MSEARKMIDDLNALLGPVTQASSAHLNAQKAFVDHARLLSSQLGQTEAKLDEAQRSAVMQTERYMKQIEALEKLVKNFERRTQEKDSTIGLLQVQLSQRGEEINGLKAEIDALNKTIETLNQTIVEKDKIIAEMEGHPNVIKHRAEHPVG